MSISNRHSIVPFISGISEALSGQRLAKVGYKSTKEGKAKFPSICVSVPRIGDPEIEGNISALLPYIKELIEQAQDGIIRGLYESSEGCLVNVSDEELSISACIGYLGAVSQGSRLTKELIEQWFVDNMELGLIGLLAVKLGFISGIDAIEELTEAQYAKVELSVGGYKGMLTGLSGGKTHYEPVKCKALILAVRKTGADDSEIGKRLIGRLEVMEKKVVSDGLLALLED
jgi:hypothetical protein